MSYPKKVTCPYCMESFKNPMIKDGSVNKVSQPDVCPHCKKRIPKDYFYGKVRTRYVYFIGPPSVGKTRLIGNMIMESEREFGCLDAFPDWAVSPDPDPNSDVNGNKTRDFYVQYAMDVDGSSVGSTRETQIGRYPMVLYKLGRVDRSHGFLRSVIAPLSRTETTYLALVDAMGDWFSFKRMSANANVDPLSGAMSKEREAYRKRFAKADAVVLVMEPGHIPGLYAVDEKDENGIPAIRQADTGIENILLYLKMLFGSKLKKLPMAFTLSQFDTLFSSSNVKTKDFLTDFANGCGSRWESDTNLAHDDIDKICSNGKALADAILNTLLEERAKNNVREGFAAFPRSCCFAVSSTGMGGLRNERKMLNPLHVLDPLLWIFYEWGCLGRNLFVKH